MSDFYLDTTTHDLEMVEGELRLCDDSELIVQRVKVSLLTFLGEWFLDTALGLDYFGQILTKGNNVIPQAEAEIRRVVEAIEGVSSLDEISITLDNRQMIIVLSITGDTSELLTFEVVV